MTLSRFTALASKCDWSSVTGAPIRFLAVLVILDSVAKLRSLPQAARQGRTVEGDSGLHSGSVEHSQ